MSRVTICFRDFAPDFQPEESFVVRALSQYFEVDVADSAEICFFSVYGQTHQAFLGPKVQVIGEPVSPDWDSTDYAIGFDRVVRDDFLRYPNWAMNLVDGSALRRPLGELWTTERQGFCLFLFHNPRSSIRNAIFQALHDRRPVTSPGSVFNNAPSIGTRHAADWRLSKRAAVRSFRFCIAAENSQMVGYTSEKIVDAFLGGAIPIYWGDPLVDLDFDYRSFVNLASFGSVSELASHVVQLDEHPRLLEPVLEIAPLTARGYEEVVRFDRVERFLKRCVESSRRHPDRARWRRRATMGRVATAIRRTGLPRLRRLF